ncbi:hypothetical protein, partial [Campylobacter fetus]|uniref:hypothetical protein n=1 Tax=Campylobacter fetus TaxID=196 RepID=UPI00190B04A7
RNSNIDLIKGHLIFFSSSSLLGNKHPIFGVSFHFASLLSILARGERKEAMFGKSYTGTIKC